MNLHAIAGNIVSAVHPNMPAQYQRSVGYTTAADGSRAPSYQAAQAVTAQKQPLSSNDLKQLDGLNLNGEKAAFYISGNWDGVSRPDQKGGDIVTCADGVWMVVQILENYYATAGWVKVATTRQMP
jgi:hypothetical protein